MQTQRGFSYVLVLFVVALLATVSVRVLEHTATAEQRARELSLLYAGRAYRAAIGAYYENTPGTLKRFPERLGDLLEDPRTTSLQRPLRRLYYDPMTGSAEWGLVRGPDERIIGVYSLSTKRPVKNAGFPTEEASFEGADQYSKWRFIYVQPSIPRAQ